MSVKHLQQILFNCKQAVYGGVYFYGVAALFGC